MPAEIKVQLCQIAASTTEATVRDHHVMIDRPASKGGTDAGPMGGELFLAAVGGCFMSNLLAAIKAREAGISNIQTEVTGTIADAPARFDSLQIVVTADGAQLDLLEQLMTIADRGCIMMNTLRGKLDVRLQIGTRV